MINFKKFYLEYIVILIPPLLLTGPFLPDLFLSCACLIFLIKILIQKKYFVFQSKFLKYFIIFWFFLLISSILGDSNNFINSIKSSFLYLRFGIFVVLMQFLITFNKNFWLKFLYSVFLTVFLITFIGLLQFSYVRLEFIEKIFDLYISESRENFYNRWSSLGASFYNRLTLPFSNEEVVGSLIVRLLPLSFILLIWKINKKKISYKLSIFIKIFFSLIMFIIWASGERTSFFLLMIQLILIFILISKIRLFFIKSFIIGLFIILTSSYVDPISKGRMIVQTIENIKGKDKIYLISSIHEGHFVGAWNIFLDNKFFGAGLKGFRYECYNKTKYKNNPKINCSTHPHNIVMQFLSETGIVGFLFYFTCFLSICIILVKKFFHNLFKKREFFINDYQLCSLVGIFITLWPLAATGNFFNNWLSIIYFMPIAFFLNKSKSAL
jgi:O-antigen ligase